MLKDIFAKNKKKYATIPVSSAKNDVPVGIMTKCPQCKKTMFTKELEKHSKVCLHCDYHFPLSAKERITMILDENTFEEMDKNLETINPLNFQSIWKKLRKIKKSKN